MQYVFGIIFLLFIFGVTTDDIVKIIKAISDNGVILMDEVHKEVEEAEDKAPEKERRSTLPQP